MDESNGRILVMVFVRIIEAHKVHKTPVGSEEENQKRLVFNVVVYAWKSCLKTYFKTIIYELSVHVLTILVTWNEGGGGVNLNLNGVT